MNARNAWSRHRAKRQHGFTLVELMVALSGGLFLSVVVFALARDASRFYQREARLATATLGAITGFERLKADIQRASYLATPNYVLDQQVRRSADARLQGLIGLSITKDMPDLHSVSSFAANKTAGQEVKPDQIDLTGSFSATDEFPGSIDTARIAISLAPNSPALARLGFIGADGTVQNQLIQGVFGVNKILRFVEMGSRLQSYGIISGTSVTSGVPRIVLDRALPNDIDGFAAGSSVSVVDHIRYSIQQVPSDLPAWKPLFDASKGAPGEDGRTELVREEIDPTTDLPNPATLDIAAEYAVDLEFGVTGQPTVGGNLVYAASSDAAFGQFFDAGGRPQGVRSVRVRLGVRSREADREANIVDGTGRLYRFKVGTNDGWARVRTFQADVPLPNQATVQW